MVFLSVRPSIAVSVLLEACEHDMKWPNYAWILHSYRLKDTHNLASSNKSCGLSKILEGVFNFQLALEIEPDAKSNPTSNPFGVLFQDALWALAFAASKKSLDDLMNITNKYEYFSEVYIYQALNLSAKLIGVYSGISNSLTNSTNIGTLAYNGPVFVRLTLSPSILVIAIMCFLFNTFLLILYINFAFEITQMSNRQI